MQNVKMYQKLARLVAARLNCAKCENWEWFEKHEAAIGKLMSDHFPSGSGFDGDSNVDLEASTPEKFVIRTEYHHMDEHGGYDGWSALTVTVKPSLAFGFNVKLTGIKRKYAHDRDYFEEVLAEFLDKQL